MMPPGAEPVPGAAQVARRALAAPARCGSTRLVCIDGPAGSGKTTLAAALAAELADAPVVHMDDLYEGWEQRLGQPLADRVDAWILEPLRSGSPGRYRRFDWVHERFSQSWVPVPVAPVVVLEGCASASRPLRQWASLVVWVEAAQGLRLQRGLERDGTGMAPQWRAWQLREAAHFAADDTRAAADVIIDTTPP